jgi:hypothetical protein
VHSSIAYLLSAENLAIVTLYSIEPGPSGRHQASCAL